MRNRIVRFHETGAPADVLRIEEETLPELSEGEAQVRVLASPINPADLNFIEGSYGIKPTLPAVPGTEGVGEVEKVRSRVSDLKEGDRVLLPAGAGAWRERLIVDANALIRISPGIPVEQAAMLRVNPATAFLMLKEFVALEEGDWVVQNASNSGVGRCVIAIARELGLRTINLVRRETLVPELKAAGADVVLLDSRESVEEAKRAAGKSPVRLALNAVGGESALNLMKVLSPGGTLVTYGAMGLQPVRISSGILIFKDLRFRGFWVTRRLEEMSRPEVEALFERLGAWAEKGVLKVAVERVYPLEQIIEAVRRAAEGGRSGKILLGSLS
jgi:trans-2-enoyl-CoA reductase